MAHLLQRTGLPIALSPESGAVPGTSEFPDIYNGTKEEDCEE